MDWVIRQGWAFYWGTSEWSSEKIKEAYGICDKLGLIRPVVEQVQYNMLTRTRFEVEFGDLFEKYHMGSTIWSPMAGGMLSGKYLDGIPEDSRAALLPMAKSFSYDPYMGTEEKKARTIAILKGLKEVADSLGCSLPQLALGWAIANRDVSTCMIGVSKV